MALYKTGINQRRSFRCPVPDSRQACVLHVGAIDIPGTLLDESADGFAVLVSQVPDISVNRTVTLETMSGRFLVKVRHVCEAAPPATNDVETDAEAESEAVADADVEQSPTADDRWCRLGLLRVGDAPFEATPSSGLADSLRASVAQWYPSGGLLTASGIFLALACLIIPLGLAMLIWHAKENGATNLAVYRPAEKRRSPFTPPPKEPTSFERRGGGSGAIEKTAAAVAKAGSAISESLGSLPGATALILPEVASRLRLTKDQFEQIVKIEEAVEQSLRKLALDSSLQGNERRKALDHRAALLEQARSDAIEVLTPEQQAEWQKLIAESRRESR